MPTISFDHAIQSALLPGLGVSIALLVILRLLVRNQALRGITVPYIFATLALGIDLIVPRLFGPLQEVFDHILTAVLIVGWGTVALGLFEQLALLRWTSRRGMALPRLGRDILRAVAFIVGALITLQLVFNISPSSILISSTVVSAVIGLALQDVLRNVFAGISLQIERPFEVGHWIQLSDGLGKVIEINWRDTRLLTVDGQSLIYPNAMVASARIINYSAPDPVQAMHTQIAVSYVHPPNLVKQILMEATLASPFVAANPPPSMKVLSYGDYSVTYDLKFWLTNYDRHPDKRDTVMTNAWYALQRAGIALPLPVREVYHHENTPDLLAEQRAQHLARVVADLRLAPVLSLLSDVEIQQLARQVHVRLYGAGDVLVRQGESGDTLFLLRSGQVRVDVQGAHGPSVTVNTLGPGACFGEMALMTGDPGRPLWQTAIQRS
jgi:small-conductance mechanosensitive channel